jgi:hypothetical protein
LFFLRGRAPGGDQPDHGIGLPVAMTDDHAARLQAVAKQQEPIFILGVIRVVDQASAFVQENGLRFLE